MNTNQLKEILKKDRYSKKYFKNVIAIDMLPRSKKKLKNVAYIVNTDNKGGPGVHWFALFYDSKSTCEFFDSFGMGPFYYNLKNFIERTSFSCKSNKFPLQSILSDYCGLYAVLFILSRSRKISFIQFLKYFGKNVIENDKKINVFLKSL